MALFAFRGADVFCAGHVREHHQALAAAGIDTGKVSPLLLPDYVVQPTQ